MLGDFYECLIKFRPINFLAQSSLSSRCFLRVLLLRGDIVSQASIMRNGKFVVCRLPRIYAQTGEIVSGRMFIDFERETRKASCSR